MCHNLKTVLDKPGSSSKTLKSDALLCSDYWWSPLQTQDPKEDTVRVAVRCRPLTPDEVKAGRGVVVRVDQLNGEVAVSVSQHRGKERERTFTFDTVFGPESRQTDVYTETARPIVDFVLEGYNGGLPADCIFTSFVIVSVHRSAGTIFAYGQTGTGKTYTMEGERVEPEKRGIIPNSFAHIFGHIAKCEGEVQ